MLQAPRVLSQVVMDLCVCKQRITKRPLIMAHNFVASSVVVFGSSTFPVPDSVPRPGSGRVSESIIVQGPGLPTIEGR